MIYGTGTDISKTSRFEKWVKNPELYLRFFNDRELFEGDCEKHIESACCHYASRFSAKEAFVKALGTGFSGIELKDFYVAKDENGRPYFVFGEKTRKILEDRAGKNCAVHLSLSHEKEFATAFVIIEKTE